MVINSVSYLAYQEKHFIIKPLVDILEGKSSGLNQKHLRRIRFMCNLILYPFFKVIGPILSTSISIIVLISMYYAYNNFDIDYNPVIHFVWAIYYCFVISQMVYTLIIFFTLISGLSFYFKFRFNQVNQLIKSNDIRKISRAIRLHKSTCDQVEQLNDVFSVHLTVFCVAMTLGWDIAFYLTLYGQTSVMRFVMANCSVCLLFGSFFTFCSGALFFSEAYKLYKIMNFFNVRNNRGLSVRIKWKVSFACLKIL